MGGLNSCLSPVPVHQRTDCDGVGETDQRRFAVDTLRLEQSGLAWRRSGHRRAHLDGRGHMPYRLPLPRIVIGRCSRYRPASKLQVSGSKPQPCQQKQNGVVALAYRGIPTAGVRDTVGSARREGLRHAR